MYTFTRRDECRLSFVNCINSAINKYIPLTDTYIVDPIALSNVDIISYFVNKTSVDRNYFE